MANIVLNEGLGRLAEIVRNGGDLQLVPLSAVAADATLKDQGPDLATVLGGGSTERTTGGWSRKVIANGSITLTVDDTADSVRVSIPDQTWTGPTAGNNVVALLLCEDNGGADSADHVISKHDFAVTTDGNDVTADVNPATGVWSSS